MITDPSFSLSSLRRRRGMRRLASLAGVAVIAALALVAVPATAQAVTGGSISGTVSFNGSPIEGVSVILFETTGHDAAGQNVVAETTSDPSGAYSLTDLPAGRYAALASGSGAYLPTWFDGQATSTRTTFITVAPGDSLVRNITLIPGTTISGHVAGPGGDAANVLVIAAAAEDLPQQTATTDAVGNYQIVGLVPGHYTLEFLPQNQGLLAQWYTGQSSRATATYFPVGAAGATGKNATLAASATVSGTLSGDSGPITDSFVTLIPHSAYDFDTTLGSSTDATGHFSISAPPGDYDLYYGGDDTYAAEFFGGTYHQSSATTVTLTGTQSIVRDATLSAKGTISGNVSIGAPFSSPGVGINVNFYLDGEFVGSTQTDNAGDYSHSVAPGQYTVEFTGVTRPYELWYINGSDASGAQPFTVGAGVVLPGISVGLPNSYGSISGTVSAADSGAVTGTKVRLLDASSNLLDSVAVGADGNYTFSNLPQADYHIHFDPPAPYLPLDYNSGGIVPVGDGSVVSGINGTLQVGASISGTSISGTVTDTASVPLFQVKVQVFTSGGATEADSTIVGVAATDADGNYSIPSLPTGDYKVAFSTGSTGLSFTTGLLPSSAPFLSQWYQNSQTWTAATVVHLTAGNPTVTGISAALNEPAFEDVLDPSSPFYTYIQWMSQQNISTGTPQELGRPLYKPGSSVSRQAMASFLQKLAGATSFVPPVDPTFADVDSSNPFYAAIEWMAAQGISTGTPQTSGKPLYKPVDPVSRQAMASFLSRYAHATLTAPSTPDFADVPIDATTAAAIHWMKTTGVSTGTPQPSGLPLYKPADPVSRQAMAAFLYRLAHLPS